MDCAPEHTVDVAQSAASSADRGQPFEDVVHPFEGIASPDSAVASGRFDTVACSLMKIAKELRQMHSGVGRHRYSRTAGKSSLTPFPSLTPHQVLPGVRGQSGRDRDHG
jgi:hypothetical protein